MSAVAKTYSVALKGLQSEIIELEADISSGLPVFTLVGLPDTALLEARERIRAACKNSQLPLPSKKITVNLSPAAVPKQGSSFDLAIAMVCLAALGRTDSALLAQTVHIGELGLDGLLRPIPGVLPSVLAAVKAGYQRVMLPYANFQEASLVPGIEIVPVTSLSHAARYYGADCPLIDGGIVELPPEPPTEMEAGDLADVSGNSMAIEALQLAAAGGHNLFFYGPPGSGKTMLAKRLPAILPDLSPEASLEVSSVASLSGVGLRGGLITRPPFEAPHHSITAAALIGGGSKRILPGAVSRASHGVLFLDEAPEFSSQVLNTLRQPLETGMITIHRANAIAYFPACFQLLLAANPCPCGNFGMRDAECLCSSANRIRYFNRISRPIIDRVDIQLQISRVSLLELSLSKNQTSTESARQRVAAARERSYARLRETPWSLNSQVSGEWLKRQDMRAGAVDELDQAFDRGMLSMRGYHKVLRLAWTIADLNGADRIGREEVGQALLYRVGV